MKMLNKVLSKSKSAPRDIVSGSDREDNDNSDRSGNNSSNAPNNPPESDLFSFLSAMHLSGSAGGSGGGLVMGGGQLHPAAAAQVLASRKRKFLDGGVHFGGGGGSGKFFGGMRHPGMRRNSDEDPTINTPLCTHSGYADDEDRQHHHRELESDGRDQQGSSMKGRQMLPPDPPLITDIDENLAADFDGSLSGLGVDINSSTYSMSEALMALPALNLGAGQMFKQETPSPPSGLQHPTTSLANGMQSRLAQPNSLKEEPLSNLSANSRGIRGNSGSPTNPKYDALDLTNDEAAHFPESDVSEDTILGPKTFTGSVSREISRRGTPTAELHQLYSSNSQHSHHHLSNQHHQHHNNNNQHHHTNLSNFSASHPNLTMIGSSCSINRDDSQTDLTLLDRNLQSHRVILPLQMQSTASSLTSLVSRKDSSEQTVDESVVGVGATRFEYILNACTSIATKVNEPSITYLNQGQSYEVTLRKLGDVNSYSRKRLFKCQLRICFHERRLQYMEQEQINEWSNKHPGERILDLDIPLSYGVVEPVKDPSQLNVISFKWDPSRDTGAFIKVNCISTEFTPKKHGGEKGVPFRLQVESFDAEDNRLHAASCILQVFKLKGADRKHKQDRDKIQKRAPTEQEKFAKPFERTFLTEIPLDSIYVPPPTSRPPSPKHEPVVATQTIGVGAVELAPGPSRNHSRDESSSSMVYFENQTYPKQEFSSTEGLPAATTAGGSTPLVLTALSSVDAVSQWLNRNRYGPLIGHFRNYNGRDLLRLSREDVISVCGLSEGIRLYNDLHMAQVAPRTTFYVAMKDTQEYDALFLEEISVAELTKRFSQVVGLQQHQLAAVYKKKNPQGFLIRVTDSVIQNTEPESVFYFSIRNVGDGSDKCDLILEDCNTSWQNQHKTSQSSGDTYNSS